MKCPDCGFASFELQQTCQHCGALMLDDGPAFRIDDDLFTGNDGGVQELRDRERNSADWLAQEGLWPADGAALPGPDFVLPDEDLATAAGAAPIIDRDDEVPERYWAPVVAGLGRRALAFLADLSLLLVVLGIFFLGAITALRLNGFEADVFLAAAGLQASALPFSLLAALLSLAYSGFFHGSTGRTPGKALVGIEVRGCDGDALSWGRAGVRWCGAALGLACAGIGILWAVFEPRRRGWADLISGSVVARSRREPAAQISRP